MAQNTRNKLKSFFQVGDIPNEGNYIDVMDSFVNIKDHNSGSIILSGSFETTTNITASGNISASGTIIAEHILSSDDIVAQGNISASGTGSFGIIEILSDVSASGDLYANKYHSNGYNLLRYHINQDRTIVGSKFKTTHITGSSLTLGDTPGFHVTASGNISSSGDVTANSFIGEGSALTSLPSQTDQNFTTTLKNKLDAIEASADVTDTTNVTAAGALMDSELTNIAAIKAINQHLTTTSNVNFSQITLNKQNLETGSALSLVTTEGQSFTITLNEIPGISGKSSSSPIRMRNAQVITSSVILATVQSEYLSVKVVRVGSGTFEIILSNESSTDFSATQAKINFVIF